MFGAQVRAYRQRLGMTQEELASRTGVSVRGIRNLEAGRTGRPRPGTVRLIAEAFELHGAERDDFYRSALEDTGETADNAGTLSGRGRPVPAQLPADVAGFVGRSDELRRLTKLLDGDDRPATVVISAIAGTAGVGKTSLAVHWGHQSLDRFPDGQLYVNLRGFDPAGTAATPDEVVRSFLDALDVPAQRVPAGLDAQTALYRSLLAGRRMLVLLDNAKDAEQVRPLLPGTPGCLVLVTSRDQLSGLVAVAGAVPVPLDLLRPDEARDLLAQRLGTDRMAAEPAAVEEIIERCARLPLALAVVAARAATEAGLSLAALAAELGHPGERLETLSTGDPGTDVRSVFSWSYQQLSGPCARLFRLLGVHPGAELSESAAASLVGIPPARVRPLLAELVRAHLITERVPGRYFLHDLLRAYAGELAGSDEQADREAAVSRLVDHYLRCAHRADSVLNPARDAIEPVPPPHGVTIDEFGSADAATEWFIAEYRVLPAAVALAVDAGLDRQAWQLVWSMASFIDNRDFRYAVAVHRVALHAARHLGDPAAQGYSHRRLGKVYAMLEEYDEAQVHLEHALEVYRRLGDDTNQAHVHGGLGSMLDRQGRHRDALHHAEQALARYEAGGHRLGQANALNAVGWCHARLGDYGTALEYCERALRLQQELGHRQGEAETWDSLGVTYHHLGRYDDAVAAYQQALALYRDNGYRFYEADSLVKLGETHHASGDTGAARDRWREALAILVDLDHPEAEQVRARLRDKDRGRSGSESVGRVVSRHCHERDYLMQMHADQLTVSAGTVRLLVDRQFPEWRSLSIRSVESQGTVNAIFRIGDQFTARFPLQPGDVEATRRWLSAEAQAARELVGRTRFATPEPVALGEPDADYPLPWSVQTWVPGVVATDEDPCESVGFAHDLAEFINDVRRIDTGGRRFAGKGRGGDLRSHDEWMETCFGRSETLLDVPRLRSAWAAMRSLPRDGSGDVMTHGDLIPGNVLVSGGRLTGVLDVGGLGPADPALDLVGAWHLLDAGPRQVLRADLGCDDLEWDRGQAWAFQQAMGAVWYYVETNPAMSRMGRRTLERIMADRSSRT